MNLLSWIGLAHAGFEVRATTADEAAELDSKITAYRDAKQAEADYERFADLESRVAASRARGFNTGTLTRLNGQLVVSEPKTQKSRRTLPLTEPVVALLRAQKAAQAADKLRAGSVWVDSGCVFTSESGHPLDPRNVLRAVETAAARAGLAGVNVHSLRHSAATTMLESGVHLKGVADMLGHSDTRITGDIYGHVSPSVAMAAMEALSSRLSSNGG